MRLRLFESRRARAVAGWALAASVAAHAASVGGWVESQRRGIGAGGGREGPISIRFLLPPDHVAAAPGERVAFVAIGPGTTGWVAGGRASPAADRTAGDAPPPEATRRTIAPPGDAADETRIFTEEDVDSAATRDPSSDGPRYPDALRAKGVQGRVLVEFTVDTAGRADPETFTVVESSDPLFADAVREALPRMHFTPAVARGRRVRQLVRLPMTFRLVTAAADASSA